MSAPRWGDPPWIDDYDPSDLYPEPFDDERWSADEACPPDPRRWVEVIDPDPDRL